MSDTDNYMYTTYRSSYSQISILSSEPERCVTIYFNMPENKNVVYTDAELEKGLIRLKLLNLIQEPYDDEEAHMCSIDILLWEGDLTATRDWLVDNYNMDTSDPGVSLIKFTDL